MDETQGRAPSRGNVSRLEPAQRKRRSRQIRRAVLAGIVILALLIWLIAAFGSGLSLASDLLESARIGMMGSGDLPADTGIEEILQLEPLAGGFAALGANDLVIFSDSGRELREIQHGYSRPAIAVGSRRFCLYNRAGTELRVESRLKTLNTMTFENPLMLCAMSQNGNIAAVTRSGRYAADVRIYDPSLKFIYGWKPTDAEGTPSRIAFAEDNRRLAVSCVRAENGAIGTGLYWLDVRKQEVQASAWIPGSMLMELRWISGRNVLAVFGDHTAVYDSKTGQETARYDYGGSRLLDTAASGKNTVLLLDDGLSASSTRLVILNGDMKPLCETAAQAGASQVVSTRKAAYSLSESSVRCFSMAGKQRWELALTEKPQALLSAKKLLLFTGRQVDELKPPKNGSGIPAAGEADHDKGDSQ